MVAYKREMMRLSGQVAGQVLQLLNGIAKFRMQGAEAQAFYLWAKPFGEEWKWNRATRWKSNWLETVNALQPILLTMLMFLADAALAGSWRSGDKTVFITQSDFFKL